MSARFEKPFTITLTLTLDGSKEDPHFYKRSNALLRDFIAYTNFLNSPKCREDHLAVGHKEFKDGDVEWRAEKRA